jgi:ABC-type multidrug transport system fused ATPase/permease subunit
MKKMWSELFRLRMVFSRREKFQYVLLLILMIIGSFLDVLGLGMVPAFVATLAMPEEVMAIPGLGDMLRALGVYTGRQLVLLGTAVLLIVFILKNLFLTWMFHIMFRTVEAHRVTLADRLFSAYLRAPYSFHLQRNSAELMRNVNTETLEIVQGVIIPLLAAIMGAIMTLFTMILLLVVTPWAAFMGLAVLGGGSAFFYSLVNRRLKRYGLIAKEERKQGLKAINQGLGALVDARVLGREEFLAEAFRQSVRRFAQVTRLRQVIDRSAPYLIETFAVGGLLGIVLILVLSGVEVNNLIPILALFGAAVIRLRQGIGKIVGGLSAMRYSIAAVPNVVNDLEKLGALRRPPRQAASIPAAPPLPFEQTLRLENVSFSYSDSEQPALHAINLEIHAGEAVAFVGPTGSGKSTLISLLLGLFPPNQGRISVDGRDIHDNLRGWLDQIGYVSQHIFLLDDTLRRNVALGLPDHEIDDQRVWDALSAAQIADFIRELPDELDTMAGERGVRLSGGQRQRIGLARALYNNPKVLVLDEATSALDNQTENLVMQAIDHFSGTRTVIMIAHRLSTVRKCDRLFLLQQGRVVAEGDYEQLILQSAEFQKLVEVF